MDKIQITYMALDELRPYENNARKHEKEDVDAIAKSIKEFGFKDPIGVWSEKNIIVEGHGRLMAAKKLGMTEVPVIRLDDLTDEQRRAYALAHNKTAELSVWDSDILAEELLSISDIDMSELGFEIEIPDENKEVEEDDYEVDLPEEPKAQLGDIYQLGRHRLMCGDSTNAEMLKQLTGGGARRYAADGSALQRGI